MNSEISALFSSREAHVLLALAQRFRVTEEDVVAEMVRYFLMLAAQGGGDSAATVREFCDLKINGSQALHEDMIRVLQRAEQAVGANMLLASVIQEKIAALPLPIATNQPR